MPRLDDPNTKLKNIKVFKRDSLRPWDDMENFKPTLKFIKGIEENPKATPINYDIPVNKNSISKQKVNQLVNNWETKSKPIGKQNEGYLFEDHSIGKQLDLQKETISKPIGNQTHHTIGKQLVTLEVNDNSDFHLETNIIKSLTGLQRIFLYYVVEECKSRGLLHTNKITNEKLRELLNTDSHSVKTTVQRIINKGLVTRKEGKRGKGGFTIFEIHEIVRNIVINEQRQIDISKQLGNQLVNDKSKQLVNNWETNKETEDSSSSSIYNKTTTTEVIASNFLSMNIQPLNHIGFTIGHIEQLTKQQKLTFDQIQDSIHYFAFDLARNNKAKALKKGPLDFFMGILRQGIPYTPPSNYESPEAESMRLYLESKSKTKQVENELQEKLKENLCQEWLENLKEHELMEFYVAGESLDSVPEKVRATLKRRNATANARQYFESEIWPSKRKEILDRKGSELSTY